MKRTQLFLTKSDVQAILLAINDCTGDVDDADLHNKRLHSSVDRLRDLKERLMTTKETKIK